MRTRLVELVIVIAAVLLSALVGGMDGEHVTSKDLGRTGSGIAAGAPAVIIYAVYRVYKGG